MVQSFAYFVISLVLLLFGCVVGIFIGRADRKLEEQEHIDSFRSGYNAASDYWQHSLKDHKHWFNEGWDAAFKVQARFIAEKYQAAEYETFVKRIGDLDE